MVKFFHTRKGVVVMKNTIKTFTLFVRPDKNSEQIANSIRNINNSSQQPLLETNDGDLIIAIGGDGTFIDAVTSTNFGKSKVYVGIHTGTLGFLQNLSPNEGFALIKYFSYEEEIKTRKMLVSSATVNLKSGETLHYQSLNEVLIAGNNYSNISFAQYVNDELLQNVVGNGIIIATNTGDTAYSMNADGAIDFSNHFQLVCTLLTPNKNAAYERFTTNPIICSKVSIVPKHPRNLSLIIDGIPKDIDTAQIESIDVSMLDGSNYIHKFELENYSKVNIVRKKILGYDF